MKKVTRCFILIVISLFQSPFATNAQNFIDATEDASVVPVKFILFEATQQNDYIKLKWITASELGNSHFNILRSANGREFTTIGSIAGNGTSNNTSEYFFNDVTVPKTNVFYQLEQVDKDGKKNLSAIILLKLKQYQGDVTVFPNPVLGKKVFVSLQKLSDGIYTVKIKNAAGIVLKQQSYQLLALTPISIDLPNHLPTGNYFMEISNANTSFVSTKQIFVQ